MRRLQTAMIDSTRNRTRGRSDLPDDFIIYARPLQDGDAVADDFDLFALAGCGLSDDTFTVGAVPSLPMAAYTAKRTLASASIMCAMTNVSASPSPRSPRPR
jgi:hypothetical protein